MKKEDEIIKDRVIELKLNYPKLTLNEIKEKLSLNCSISTISNYLRGVDLRSRNIYKAFGFINEMGIFESSIIQIKHINDIEINNVLEDIYIVSIIDVKTGIVLLGFSFFNSSEIPTLFIDYALSKFKDFSIKISEIISSKNKVFFRKGRLSEMGQVIVNKFGVRYRAISNKEKIIEKFYKGIVGKIYNTLKKEFISVEDFQDELYLKQLVFNMDIIRNLEIKKRKFNKLNQLNYSFEPLSFDDFLLEQKNIINSLDYWSISKSNAKFRIDEIHNKSILALKEKGDKLILQKNNFKDKIEIYDRALEIIDFEQGCTSSNVVKENNKLKSMLSISKGMVYYQVGMAKETNALYRRALNFALKSNSKSQIATSYYFLADQFRRTGKRKYAKNYYEKSLELFTEIDSKGGMGYVLGLLSGLMKDMRQLGKALDFAKKMLLLVEEINDKKQISIAKNKIAIIYRNMKKYDEALLIYNERLEYSKKIEDNYLTCICYGNISNIYSDILDFDQALIFQNKQIFIAEKIDHKILIGKGFSGIASIYLQNDSIEMAIKSYKRALDIFNKLKHKKEIYNCLTNLGDLYKKRGSITLARNCYRDSMNIAQEIGDKFLLDLAMVKMKERNQ